MNDNQIISMISMAIVAMVAFFVVWKFIHTKILKRALAVFLVFNFVVVFLSILNLFGFFNVPWEIYAMYLAFLMAFLLGASLCFSDKKYNETEGNIFHSMCVKIDKILKTKRWMAFCVIALLIQLFYMVRFLFFARGYDNAMLAREAFYSNFFINGFEYYFYVFFLSTARVVIEILSVVQLARGKYKSVFAYIGLLIVIMSALTGFGRMEIVNFLLYYLFVFFVFRKNRRHGGGKIVVVGIFASLSILSLLIISNRVQQDSFMDVVEYQAQSIVQYYTVGFRNLDDYVRNGFEDVPKPSIVRGTLAGIEEMVTIPVTYLTDWEGTFNRITAVQTQIPKLVGIDDNGNEIKMNAFYTCIMPLYNDLGVFGVVFYAFMLGVLVKYIFVSFYKNRTVSLVVLIVFIFVRVLLFVSCGWGLQSAEAAFTAVLLFVLSIIEKRFCRKNNLVDDLEGGDVRKILWTTNVIMPYPAKQIGKKPSVFGGWLIGLMKQIVKSEKYKLAVAAVYDGNKFRRFDDGKIVYYLLPCKNDTKYNGDLEYYWCETIADFQPDLIHLHGTEFMHNLALQNACPNEKYLVSLQGLMGPISKKYLAGIPKKEYRKNVTPRDFLRGSVLKEQKGFYRRAEYEKMILKNANAIVGRTGWDRVNSLKIAGEKPYFKCNEILRDAFYDQNWNIREVEPHSIYVSQAGYPIKGFHILLEALPKLVEKYPDLKVRVAGPNILDRSTFRKRLLYSGYAKILENKIKKYRLEKNIIFIGEKTEAEVLEYMKKSNVFVQCSVVENSSNSLGEAMLIGMPCVASDVGGTADLLDATRGEGLLYRFGDARTLAELISKVFDDFGLAAELGENAKKHAKIIYDRQENTDTMLEIYEKVINS